MLKRNCREIWSLAQDIFPFLKAGLAFVSGSSVSEISKSKVKRFFQYLPPVQAVGVVFGPDQVFLLYDKSM